MHKNTSFHSFLERRLVFQNPASGLSQTPEDLLQQAEKIAFDAEDDKQEAISALGELVERRDELKEEQIEKTRDALVFAREQVILRGEQEEQKKLADIERKFEETDAPDQEAETPKEKKEKEDEAFFEDPVAWLKNAGSGITQIFKKASSPTEWLKGIAAAGTMLAASWDKIKDYVASAVGPVIASLKDAPVFGKMFSGIENFIGAQRRALFAKLSEKGIELKLSIVSYARKGIDDISKELSATTKGWNADRLAGEFTKLLSATVASGTLAANVSRDQIDDIIGKLRVLVGESENLGEAKTKLDDFGLEGWKEGEAKEVGDGIKFKIKGVDTFDYAVKENEIKIEGNTFNVSAKVGTNTKPDIDVLFEPHIDSTTLAKNSKVIYKRTVGDVSEVVSITLDDLKKVDDKGEKRDSGGLEVSFVKV